jgi:hypothetical protein
MNRLVPVQSALSPHLETGAKTTMDTSLSFNDLSRTVFQFSPLSVRFCLARG